MDESIVALAPQLALFLPAAQPALAITAPEPRGQRSVQDLQPDMHGRNLQQEEFLKASMEGFDLSETDLRGAVFNTTSRTPTFQRPIWRMPWPSPRASTTLT